MLWMILPDKCILNENIILKWTKDFTKFDKPIIFFSFMAAILLQSKNIDKSIMDLVYDKQLIFTKEKARKVSLEQTICRLLKEAYLTPPK